MANELGCTSGQIDLTFVKKGGASATELFEWYKKTRHVGAQQVQEEFDEAKLAHIDFGPELERREDEDSPDWSMYSD